MFHVFTPPLNTSDLAIDDQFVEVTKLDVEEETKLWKKYESIVDTIGKEKLHRFKEMQSEIIEIWKGVRSESDKSSELYTMNVMLQRMQCMDTSLSDDQLYTKYLEMKINHYKKQIELYEKCFNACFKINRRKYNYGLKVRGIDRLDIPENERFTIKTIQKFIQDLENSIEFYEENIRRMRINTSSMSSHIIIQQLLTLFVNTFTKQRRIHLREIEYYQQLYQTYSELDSTTRSA